MRIDVSGHLMTFRGSASDFKEAAPAAISILQSFLLPLALLFAPGLAFASQTSQIGVVTFDDERLLHLARS
jgi:hypothetical protein